MGFLGEVLCTAPRITFGGAHWAQRWDSKCFFRFFLKQLREEEDLMFWGIVLHARTPAYVRQF